jgi:hypothetical protein
VLMLFADLLEGHSDQLYTDVLTGGQSGSLLSEHCFVYDSHYLWSTHRSTEMVSWR